MYLKEGVGTYFLYIPKILKSRLILQLEKYIYFNNFLTLVVEADPEINERERKQSTVKPPDPKDFKRKESRTSTIKSTDKEKESDKGSKSEKGCNSFGAHIFERKEVFVWYLMAPLLLKG